MLAERVFALVLCLAITAVAVSQYRTGSGLIQVSWLAVGPLLASLLLRHGDPAHLREALASGVDRASVAISDIGARALGRWPG